MKYRNVDPLIAFGSKVISIPPPCMSARWTDMNCRQRGGRGADALVFSRGPCALLTCLDSSVAAVIRSALTGKQGVCGRT